MKRLIKKSDIYDGFKYDNKYFECFKNPSASEIREVKRVDPNHSIRGVILDNKEIYVWPGNILHDSINHKLSNEVDIIDINQFRFAYEPGSRWLIDAHYSYDYDEITDLIIEYADILEDIGDIENINFDLFFYNGDHSQPDMFSLAEIKEYKLKNDIDNTSTEDTAEDDSLNDYDIADYDIVDYDIVDYDIVDYIDIDDFDQVDDNSKQKQYVSRLLKR